MEKRSLLVAVGLTFVFIISILLLNQNVIGGQDRIVTIMGEPPSKMETIRLDPANLVIEGGTVVIWVNKAGGETVKLNFREGKACDDATESPVGFTIEASGCYVTDWIPGGATSSLKFNERGTFKYIVEGPGGIKAEGTIEVKW